MLVGAKVCELADGFLWFVCGNFDVSPKSPVFYSSVQSQASHLLVTGGLGDGGGFDDGLVDPLY